MTTAGGKTGGIGDSSIVDLKAELYRKQLEYHQQKSTNTASGSYIQGHKHAIPKKSGIFSKQNSGVSARAAKDESLERLPGDDLERSRQALEAKSKLYDKLTAQGDDHKDQDGNSIFMVDFEQKFVDNAMELREKRLEMEAQQDKADGDWVDYVDSLGRSRRCLKEDLPKHRELDGKLGKTMNSESVKQETPDLLSEDMKREMLREKWEAEQREMMENQDTVHYSNVQFDEIRHHGAGYFQFSKNEETRQAEFAKLQKLREETVASRASRERIKDKRKQMIEARLSKVRERRKAQGKAVPEQIEEDVDKEPDPEPVQKAETVKRPGEQFIREWDEGKPGVLPSETKKLRGWTDPHDVRDEDFAPPSFYYEGNKKPDTSSASNKRPPVMLASSSVPSQPELSKAPINISTSDPDSLEGIPLPGETPAAETKENISQNVEQMLRFMKNSSGPT